MALSLTGILIYVQLVDRRVEILADRGIAALSGVVAPEANAPYVHWLEAVCSHLDGSAAPRPFTARDLPPALAAEWLEWLPAQALWLPLAGVAGADGSPGHGALILARDQAWGEGEQQLLAEWADMLAVAGAALRRPTVLSRWRRIRQPKPEKNGATEMLAGCVGRDVRIADLDPVNRRLRGCSFDSVPSLGRHAVVDYGEAEIRPRRCRKNGLNGCGRMRRIALVKTQRDVDATAVS